MSELRNEAAASWAIQDGQRPATYPVRWIAPPPRRPGWVARLAAWIAGH